MKYLGLAFALLVFVSQEVFGQSGTAVLQKFTPATNAYARRMLKDEFHLVDDLKKIDPEVLKLFHSKVQPQDIANRGEPFNSTDVVTSNAPIFRRFVLAGNAPGIWFIWYEHGGIAYHHNLVVFSKNGQWQIVAAVMGLVKGDNFDSLKEAIKTGQLFSQPASPQF